MKRGMRFAYPLASFSLKKSLTKRRLCEAYEKPQWKGLLNCKRGRPMEGRPRTSTLSFSLPLVCSLILNGIVIFMFLKLKSLVKGLKFKIALFKIDVKYYFNITCIELKYLSSLLSCDIKILYYNILLFLNL